MPQHEDTSGSVTQFVQAHLHGLAAADQALVIGWLRAVQRRNCQPTTLKTYCGALKTFVHSWDGHRPASLLQVQRTHIEHFLDHLQTRGLHPSTINAVLGCVHRFYAHLIREEQLDASPIRSHHYLLEPEPLPRALSDVQAYCFVAVLDQILERAVFLLLLRSGIRLGELVALEMPDVDLEAQQLIIRQGHKNRRGRVVYFSADAQQALRRWLQCRWAPHTSKLFHNYCGRPLNHRWVQRHFRAYAERAGLERWLTVHSLRHTFACQLLNAGVDLVTLQELLGHDSITITQRYAQLSDRMRRAEYFQAITQIEQGMPHGPTAAAQLSPLPPAPEFLGLHGA
jgi:site-specific recombinase XerD